ncbi:type II and III secretion system protein family protein [Propionivibrio sp.]|uniref:type II and III secretion system protein family protein n=1 Tax=Propionivibrio sp. TaxID=2212460 RepID=UPI00272E2A0C|nr:type II and III secretion system protein family protein [Propionivibrio sp.]
MMSAKFLPRPMVMALALAIACTPAFAAPARPTAPKPAPQAGGSPCATVNVGPIVRLAVGKASVLKLQAPVARILLGNPEESQAMRPVAVTQKTAASSASGASGRPQNARKSGAADVDVLLLSSREIYLLGKTVGATNIIMLDRNGQCTIVDLSVGVDTVALEATFKELLPNETGIKVTSAADSLVLQGTVSDALAADQAIDIASAYVRRVSGGAQMQGTRAAVQDQIINMLSIAAPQQVMLEVKAAEISKALLDQFGINFTRAYASGSAMKFLSGIFGGNTFLGGRLAGMSEATVGLGLANVLSGGSAMSGISSPSGSITAENGTVTEWPIAAGKSATTIGIDAQKQDGLLKILAEPTIMAISGQTGSFLAGGKIFIPVAQNTGGGTAITLEEKPFGVGLDFTPTVLGDGRINLNVDLVVSELSAQGVTISSTNTGGTQILPAMTQRRAKTTVQLMDGQSFAIGGLIKNNVTTNLTAFPFLGELPIIGALFRSTSFQNDRSELVFVVTPRLVKPLPPDYALPTDGYVPPTRSDMILGGRLEGRKDDVPPPPPPAIPAEPAPAVPQSGGFEVK